MGKSLASRLRRKLQEEEVEVKKEKKLYVFFWHSIGAAHTYSLYALDISEPTTTVAAAAEPERVRVSPVLLIPQGWWPSISTCACLDSKLYFMGGEGMDDKGYTYPRDVYILDLTCSATLAKLSSFRDRPWEVLKRGPSMNTGKHNPISFVADGKIFVFSGMKNCPQTYFTSTPIHQLEYLDLKEDNPRWRLGAEPPFTDMYYVGPCVVADREVIIQVRNLSGGCYLYSYHLDSDTWSLFDATCWTKVDDSPLGFSFGDGSQFIGDTIYTMSMVDEEDVPVIIPLKKEGSELKKDNKEELKKVICKELKEDTCLIQDSGKEELKKKRRRKLKKRGKGKGLKNEGKKGKELKYFNVIKYRIPAFRLSGHLTRGGESSRLCYVQVGSPPLDPTDEDPRSFNYQETHISATFIDVHEERQSAKHVGSVHYFTHPRDTTFTVCDAYVV